MLIIGISGKIEVGKSTTARILYKNERFLDSWRDFGDEVKRECSQVFNYPLIWNYSPEGKDKIVMHPELPNGSMTVRGVLQWWGTDVRRLQDPYYWIRAMERWIYANQPSSLVIADVRFREEAQMIRAMGGWLFRILPYHGWISGESPGHKSETDLDSYGDWDKVFAPEYGDLKAVAEEIVKVVEGK